MSDQSPCACGLRPCLLHYWERKEGRQFVPTAVRTFEDYPEARQPTQKPVRVAGTTPAWRGKARRPRPQA